jgi:hypothetical protein
VTEISRVLLSEGGGGLTNIAKTHSLFLEYFRDIFLDFHSRNSHSDPSKGQRRAIPIVLSCAQVKHGFPAMSLILNQECHGSDAHELMTRHDWVDKGDRVER